MITILYLIGCLTVAYGFMRFVDFLEVIWE